MTTSATDLISMLLPGIVVQFDQLLKKFCHDFDNTLSDKKGKQSNINTQAIALLVNNFPHGYQTYEACVDSFVEVARYSPESAVAVLLNMLPDRPHSSLFPTIVSQLRSYSSHPSLINLFLIQYFADCTAQILTVDPCAKYADEFFELAYSVIAPFTDEYETPLRESIARQFSVIFSVLSINHLSRILDNFTTIAKKSDLSLFFILHRFIRLSFSDTVKYNKLQSFFTDLNKMNPLLKGNKKSNSASNNWAMAINYLISQISMKEFNDFFSMLENIYKTNYPKATGKKPHLSHVLLCSTIIVRVESIGGKNADDFLKDVIFRSKDPKFLEQSLCGFLLLIRGSFVSRSTSFWEWGSFNAKGNPGIEFTHLRKPQEDQSLSNSFTSQFFNHFVSMPIEQYPKIIGDILLNFAARDFKYFIQTTVPRLVSELGPERTVLCLEECMQKLLDPNRHFAEWSQENPRNSIIRIDQSASLLFVPLKPAIFSTFKIFRINRFTDEAFCFQLTDSRDAPKFSLPFKTEPLSQSLQKRIFNATITVGKVLESWSIRDSPSSEAIRIELCDIQQVTEEELKLIKILEFIPNIINVSDLMSNEFGLLLIDSVLCESKAISVFTIRVINQIFAANEDSRIVIYHCLVTKMKSIINKIHIFILLQLLVKLFDLSLAPNCQRNHVVDFANHSQPLILYLFTFDLPEIRDWTILLVERIRQFCTVFNVSFLIDEILYKYNPIISAVVRYKITVFMGNDINNISSSFATFREAALSRYNYIYRYFLVEIATVFSHLVSPQILTDTFKMLLQVCGPQPKDVNSEEFVRFTNVFTVMTHLMPTFSHNSTVLKYLENRMIQYYGFPSVLKRTSEEAINELKGCKANLLSMLHKSLSSISPDQPTSINTANINLLRFIDASIIGGFMPIFLKWCIEFTSPKLHPIHPLASEVCKNMTQSTDLEFSLMAYESGKTAIVQFILFLEKHISEMKLAIKKPDFVLDRGDLTTAYNYCYIVKNFTDALKLPKPPVNEGPIFVTKKDEWAEKNWTMEQKRFTLTLLYNWANLREERDSQIAMLGSIATNALGSLIKYCVLFEEKGFPFTREYENFVIMLEKGGSRILPSVLSNHNFMYDQFASKMFSACPEDSLFYFLAVGFQYYIQDDNSYAEQLGFNLKSNAVLAAIKPDDLAIAAAKETIIISNPQGCRHFSLLACKPNKKSLTENDVEANVELMKYTPKIIIAVFLYLMHSNQKIQQTAFNILLRIIPVVLTIINPEDPQFILNVMNELQELAPLFNSELSTVSIETVQKVCTVFANSIPFLSDVLLQEAFSLIKSAKTGSFLSPSTNGVLLQLVTPLIFKQPINNMHSKKKWPKAFIMYSPLTFIDELVSISPFLERRDILIFLSIWDEFAKSPQNIEVIVSHLINIDCKPNNTQCIKMVLVRLSKSDSEKVIDALADRLSYAYWFKSTLQGKFDTTETPRPQNIKDFDAIILTLSELVQPYFSQIVQKLHFILNFVLINYDPNNYYLSDLILLILAQFKDCPESLAKIFVPPTSLIWPTTLQLEEDGNKEFTATDISLQPFSKQSIIIPSFVGSLIEYLKTVKNPKNGDEIIADWGKEIVRWICGCGELLIASRAAVIFSEILSPITSDIMQSLIKSLKAVVKSGHSFLSKCYITSSFILYSKIFDLYHSDESLYDLFFALYKIAVSFTQLSDNIKICEAALPIITKFINYFGINDISDMGSLTLRLSSIAATFKDRNQIYAAMLAIFKQEIDHTESDIATTALACFLAFVFTAHSAYYNIMPFSGEMKDSEIQKVFQCLPLISTGAFVSNELKQLFNSVFSDPASIEPDEFLMHACILVTGRQKKFILRSAPFLYQLAALSKSSSLLYSVFAVVGCFFQAVQVDDEIIREYSQIVKIAAKHKSRQATELLQNFLQKVPAFSDNVPNSIPQPIQDDLEQHLSWEGVIDQIYEITANFKADPYEPENDLKEPIVVTPLENWKSDNLKETKKLVQNISVVNWSFTRNEKRLKKLRRITINPKALSDFYPPIDSGLYSYRRRLSDVFYQLPQ